MLTVGRPQCQARHLEIISSCSSSSPSLLPSLPCHSGFHGALNRAGKMEALSGLLSRGLLPFFYGGKSRVLLAFVHPSLKLPFAGFLDRPLLIAVFSSFQLHSKQKLRSTAPQAPACPVAGAQRGHPHPRPGGVTGMLCERERERESNRLARSVPWLAPLISVCMSAFEYESRESNSQEPSHHLCHGKGKQDARRVWRPTAAGRVHSCPLLADTCRSPRRPAPRPCWAQRRLTRTRSMMRPRFYQRSLTHS